MSDEENIIDLVFSSFTANPCFAHHCFTFSISRLTIDGASLESEKGIRIETSSAYLKINVLERAGGSVPICKAKRYGARTDPFGTPDVTFTIVVLMVPLKRTRCLRSDR